MIRARAIACGFVNRMAVIVVLRVLRTLRNLMRTRFMTVPVTRIALP